MCILNDDYITSTKKLLGVELSSTFQSVVKKHSVKRRSQRFWILQQI